jgi:hypothetical protein
MFAQHPQHPPLLIRQTVLAQAGPGMAHDRFACLQEQARQVAVDEGGGWHLLNILNEFTPIKLGVNPCFEYAEFRSNPTVSNTF